MPTYEYRCDACEHEFEEFQSITAKPLRKCPQCGRMKLRRLIGVGAGIIFKGSGFYETDYRSDKYKKAAQAESKSDGGDGKSESQSDGKTESKDSGKSDDKSAGGEASTSKTSSDKSE